MKTLFLSLTLLATLSLSHAYVPKAFAHDNDDEEHTHLEDDELSDEEINDGDTFIINGEVITKESPRDRRKRQAEEVREFRKNSRERREEQKEEIRELRERQKLIRNL